jgi:hypothetical protein
MKWVGYGARLAEGEAFTVFSWGILKDRDHWGDIDLDWRIILRWI